MTAAYKAALDAANVDLAHIEYRIGDLVGEHYFFKQSTLASLRLERGRTAFQDFWSPGENLGNVGAAVVPVMIGMALVAAVKGYAPGSPVLIEASGDDGACGAAVLHDLQASVARRAA
jgi:3-oxoacyl-[acyl-carrier-protein] synthase-1